MSDSVTDDLNTFMDESVRELKWAFVKGGVDIAVSPDMLEYYLTYGLSGVQPGVAAAEANYAKTADYIKKLDGELRQKVLSGSESIGSWAGFAKDVASDITAQTQFAWDSSYIANAPQSAWDALKAAGDKLDHPTSWPWWIWIPIGASALYLLKPVFEVINGIIKKPSAAAEVK